MSKMKQKNIKFTLGLNIPDCFNMLLDCTVFCLVWPVNMPCFLYFSSVSSLSGPWGQDVLEGFWLPLTQCGWWGVGLRAKDPLIFCQRGANILHHCWSCPMKHIWSFFFVYNFFVMTQCPLYLFIIGRASTGCCLRRPQKTSQKTLSSTP